MTTDSWHFPRPSLAEGYLQLFELGPGEPLTLFSPRRTGKTSFLQHDLAPLARRRGMLPVYADLWQDRLAPAEALLYALAQARNELEVPRSKLGRRLATSVKKVGALGASIDLGDEPAGERPERPFLRIDFELREIVRVAKRPVLLLLDEVQELAVDADGEALVAAIRSTLTTHKGRVFTIFTGSSEDRLQELFGRAKAPLFHFSSHLVFPLLDQPFVEFIAGKYERVTAKRLDVAALWRAFVAFEQRPKPFIDMVVDMLRDAATQIEPYMQRHLERLSDQSGYAAIWAGLAPLSQAILERLGAGVPLSSAEALAGYAKRLGVERVSPGSVHYALRKLRAEQLLVSGGGRGDVRFESEHLASWVRGRALPAPAPRKKRAVPARRSGRR